MPTTRVTSSGLLDDIEQGLDHLDQILDRVTTSITLLETAPDTGSLAAYEDVDDRLGEILAQLVRFDEYLDSLDADGVPQVVESEYEARAEDAVTAVLTAIGYVTRAQRHIHVLTDPQASDRSEQKQSDRVAEALTEAYEHLQTAHTALVDATIVIRDEEQRVGQDA